MTAYDFLREGFTGSAAIIILLLTLIQIAPIKINPWSKIATKVGTEINKEVMNEVKGIKADVAGLHENFNKLEDQFHENMAIEARDRILRFGDEVSHGMNHSRDHFQQVMVDITFYNQYCDDHPKFKNNMTKLTSKRIEEDYLERDKNNSFL